MSSTLPELSIESPNDTRKRHTFNKTIAYVPHNTTADKTANNNKNKYNSNKNSEKEKQGTTILHSKRALGWHSAIGANVDSPLPSTTVNKNYTTTTITGESKVYNKEHMSDENKMNRIGRNNDNYESNKTNFVNQYSNSNDNNTKIEEKHNRESKSSNNNKNAVKLLEEDTLLSEFELPVITNITSPVVTSEGSSPASSWSTSKAATGITTKATTKKVDKHHSRDAEAFRQNMTDFLNVMYQGSISPTYLQSMKPSNNSKNSFNKAASFSGGKSHTSHITTTTNVPVSDKWSTSNALVTFTSDDATRPRQTSTISTTSSSPLLTKQSATNEKKLAADTSVHTLNKDVKAKADSTHSTNNKITTKTASENATQSSLPPFSPKTRYEDNIDALVNHLVRVLAHSNISNSNSNNNIINNNNNKLRNWSGSNKRSSQSSSQSELSPLQFHKTVQWSAKGDKEEEKEEKHQEQESDRQSSTSANAETEKAHVHKYKNREWLNAQHLNSPSNALNTTSVNNNNNNNNFNKNKGRNSNSDKITNTDVTANANALHKNKILSRSQLTLSQSTSPSSSSSSPSSHKATSPTARQWNVNTDVSQFVGQAMDNMFGNVSLYGASIINNHSSRSVLSTLWTDPNFAHLISFETKSHLNTADSNAFYDGNENSEEESMTVVPIHVGTQALFQPISSQTQLSVSKSLEMPLYLPHVTNHHNTFTNSVSSSNNNNISLHSLNSKCVPLNKSSTIPAMTTPTEGKSEKRTITSAEERAMSAVKELKLLNAQSKTAATATALVPDESTCANNKIPEHESKNEEQTNLICQNEVRTPKTKRNDTKNNINTHSQCKKSLQSMSLNSALLLNKTNFININANNAIYRNNKENKNSKEMLVERQDSWAMIDAQMKQSNNNTDNDDGNKNKNCKDDLLSLQSMQEHQVNNKYGKNENNVVAERREQQQQLQKELYKSTEEAILDAKHNYSKVTNNTSMSKETTMSVGEKQQQDAQAAKLSISKNNSIISSKGTRRMSSRLENSTDLTKLIDDEALSRNVLVAVERQLRNYIQLITSEKM